MSLTGICLAHNYYVGTWLKDEDVDIELRRYFKNIGNKSPYYDESDTLIIQQQQTSIYSYNNVEALGLGFAHLRETLAVSFSTHPRWDTSNITLERWFDERVEPVQIRHAALPSHIDTLKRIFECNPKHGWCGKGAQPNQSVMYCCTIAEAEILLNTALVHPQKERWFCNYDPHNKRFIVFLPHETGKYHGFHYENTPNADPDRDLNNPKNGIPKSMQAKLRERMKDF
jgi:hypothetical protein